MLLKLRMPSRIWARGKPHVWMRYQSGFFKENWDILGEHITNVAFNILSALASLYDTNHTNLVLILKSKNPLTPVD